MEDLRDESYTTEWSGGCCPCGEISREISGHDCHLVEKDLVHQLAARSDVEFDGLVVRRISGDTVCLEGVVRSQGDDLNIDDYVKALYGVGVVINRLVARSPSAEQQTAHPAEEAVTDWR